MSKAPPSTPGLSLRNASFCSTTQSRHIHVQIALGVPILSVGCIPVFHATFEAILPSRTRKSTMPSPCTSYTTESRMVTCVLQVLSGGHPKLPPPTMMPTHSCVL